MNSPSDTPHLEPWPIEPETCPEDLKPQINAWLWTHLPPNMTLGEAEDIACDLDARIRAAWDRFKPQPSQPPGSPR